MVVAEDGRWGVDADHEGITVDLALEKRCATVVVPVAGKERGNNPVVPQYTLTRAGWVLLSLRDFVHDAAVDGNGSRNPKKHFLSFWNESNLQYVRTEAARLYIE